MEALNISVNYLNESIKQRSKPAILDRPLIEKYN